MRQKYILSAAKAETHNLANLFGKTEPDSLSPAIKIGMADSNPITLTRFILQETQHFSATGDFAILLQSIQLACKAIASATRRIGNSIL